MDIAINYENEKIISSFDNCKFSNPNFKFKKIIRENNSFQLNGIFEIFESVERKDIYLVSQNYNYNLDIISINDIQNCKTIVVLKGHKDFVNIVRYFKKVQKNEYLISVDKKNVIILWDINNNFSNYYTIENNSSIGNISCVLVYFNNIDFFPNINNDKYIIFCFNNKCHTKIYSFDKKEKKDIDFTNEYATNYILIWHNKNEDLIVLIELSKGVIYFYNLEDCDLYLKFSLFNNSEINCGFIYNDNNTNDYLIFSSSFGIIYKYDLINEEKVSEINLYNCSFNDKNYFPYITQWSYRYFIVCEKEKRGFLVVDLETLKIISCVSHNLTIGIICAKKFYHPIHGESLLTSGKDDNITLWTNLGGLK